jgi:hypothetical protein
MHMLTFILGCACADRIAAFKRYVAGTLAKPQTHTVLFTALERRDGPAYWEFRRNLHRLSVKCNHVMRIEGEVPLPKGMPEDTPKTWERFDLPMTPIKYKDRRGISVVMSPIFKGNEVEGYAFIVYYKHRKEAKAVLEQAVEYWQKPKTFDEDDKIKEISTQRVVGKLEKPWKLRHKGKFITGCGVAGAVVGGVVATKLGYMAVAGVAAKVGVVAVFCGPCAVVGVLVGIGLIWGEE